MKINPVTRHLTTMLLMLASLGAAALLSGCGTGSKVAIAPGPVPIPIAAGSVTGTFMGGQQPVAGVALQLYAAGTTGYGSAAMTLLAPGAVTTTVAGNFNLPAFTCPSSSSLIYLVGTGGTPIGGSQNSNLSMMAGLGACGALQTSLSSGSYFITVNEVTTVGTVYALSPFMTGVANIGAPASNTAGITNAFAAINKVVNVQTGQASGPALPVGATLPVTEINALGDVLQNCVNSAGGAANDSSDGYLTGTPCGKLFFLTKTAGTTPTDTITATMLLAQNPGLPLGASASPTYVARLNDLQASSPAFTPSLSVNSPPSAFTIAITYNGGGLSTPSAVATDAAGNVWISNKGNSSVTELNNAGAALSPAAGFTAGSINTPGAITIDQNGVPWIANGNNTVTKLATTGTSGIVYTGNGMNVPSGIAIDSLNNVWVTNSGTSGGVSAFTNAGAAMTNSPFSGTGGVNAPVSIAISGK